jgi:hypothetical protein
MQVFTPGAISTPQFEQYGTLPPVYLLFDICTEVTAHKSGITFDGNHYTLFSQ